MRVTIFSPIVLRYLATQFFIEESEIFFVKMRKKIQIIQGSTNIRPYAIVLQTSFNLDSA